METPDRKTKQADEIFCWSCGEPIKKEAVICIRCGVQTRPLIPQGNTASTSFGAQSFPVLPTHSKDKTTAVLLAVFLSFWAWLYTFKRDKRKFIFACLVLFLSAPLLLLGIFLAHDFGLYSIADRETIMLPIWIFLFTLALLGFWLWAIIVSSVRSKNWYASYPNG